MVARWLPLPLSLSPPSGNRSLPHSSSKDLEWILWGSTLGDRLSLLGQAQQITGAREGHSHVTSPSAPSPAEHVVLLSEKGTWMLSRPM